jgi:hypothetical protein
MLAVLALLAAATVDPATVQADGPAATCLIVGRQMNYKVIDEGLLLIRAGGRWHRSVLPDGCPGLAPNRIIVRREASPRLCANDLVEVRDNFTPQVFSLCRIGPLEPLAKGMRF